MTNIRYVYSFVCSRVLISDRLFPNLQKCAHSNVVGMKIVYILNAPVMPFSKSNFNWPVLIKILQFWWQQSPQWSQPWDSCVIHTQHTRTSFWNIFFNNNHNNEATDGIVLFIITTLILYFNIRILQLWRQRSQWYSCGIYILWNCLIGPSGKLSEFVCFISNHTDI